MDNDAEGRGDGDGDAGGDGVGDVDELDFEGAEFDLVVGFDDAKVGVDFVFFEAAFDEGEGEGGAVDGHIHLGEEEGDAADVVFVPVREDEATDKLFVFLEIGEIRGDDVDTEEFGVGEHHAGVNNDDVIPVAEGHGVHAELAEAAERDYLQFTI